MCLFFVTRLLSLYFSLIFDIYFLKFIYFYLFIYFLAVLGLRCCAQAFSSCGEWGLLLVVVPGLLIVVASLVAEHGLWSMGASVDAAHGL